MPGDSRAVLLKPGDLLVIGNTGELSPEAVASCQVGLVEIKEALSLAGVVIFEENVDLTAIDAEQVEQLMERQRQRRRKPALCARGLGGGETCYRERGHEGDCDPDSTEVFGG